MNNANQLPNKSKSSRLLYLLPILAAFWWLPFSFPFANKEQEKQDDTQIIEHLLHHVEDHYALNFGDLTVSLPIIVYKKGAGLLIFSSHHLQDSHGRPQVYQGLKYERGKIRDLAGQPVYDFSITKNVVWMLISVLLMLIIFFGLVLHIRRRRNQPPKGYWVLPFYLVRFVRNNIARKYVGEKHYRRFTPYLLTLFFYIFLNNLLGLLPEGPNITGNFSITMTLAMVIFLIANWNGTIHYWKHIFQPPGLPVLMYPIIVPLEILTLLLKPFILATRLFANMLSGHLVILCIIGLIFLLKAIFTPIILVPVVVPAVVLFSAAMILLKIFVSFIQAYVFTLFAAMLFGKAVEEH